MLDTPFNVGDHVAFRNRCQPSAAGMTVQEVDFTLWGVRLKVDYKWWVPENFMPYQEWANNFYKDRQ
jgi:hypothetical protein